MLPLELLQTTMARSVLITEPAVAAKMLTAGKADPMARLRIYQNNTRSSLTAVLMAVFPVDTPVVAETARLEWAIAEALDAASLPPRTLAEYDKADLSASPDILLQPSLRLIVSHWSILYVWTAHQHETAVD
ncbi:MAG: DUF2063 domain-containing protein, partial [Mesorhizobium sp.]